MNLDLKKVKKKNKPNSKQVLYFAMKNKFLDTVRPRGTRPRGT